MKQIFYLVLFLTPISSVNAQKFSSIDKLPDAPQFSVIQQSEIGLINNEIFIKESAEKYTAFLNKALKEKTLEDSLLNIDLFLSRVYGSFLTGDLEKTQAAIDEFVLRFYSAKLMTFPFQNFINVKTRKDINYDTATVKYFNSLPLFIRKTFFFPFGKGSFGNGMFPFDFDTKDTVRFEKMVKRLIKIPVASTEKMTMIEMSTVLRCAAYKKLTDEQKEIVTGLTSVLKKQIEEYETYWKSKWNEMEYSFLPDTKISSVLVCNFQRFNRKFFNDSILWRNTGEIPDNNKDDDNNGIIDDLNGYQYNFFNNAVKEKIALGFNEFDSLGIANYFTEQARNFPKMKFNFKDYFKHGDMSIELMAKGNSMLKVLAIEHNQYNDRYKMIQNKFTNDIIFNQSLIDSMVTLFIRSFKEMCEYCNKHKVRLVEINSMGLEENSLVYKGCGKTDDERKIFAKKMFSKMKTGLSNAYKKAPNTLFILGAGNDNIDINISPTNLTFIRLPNILIVGALDKDLKRAFYSNYGDGVELYTPAHFSLPITKGYTESNGTSAAAPVACNLAIKILALKPTLKPSQVRQIMISGGDKDLVEKNINVINPKKTIKLLF